MRRFGKSVILVGCLLGLSVNLFAQDRDEETLTERVKRLEQTVAEKDLEIREMKKAIQDLSKQMQALPTTPASGSSEHPAPAPTVPALVFEKVEEIKSFKEFVCQKGHIFSSLPEGGVCPMDGTVVRERSVLKKVKLARRESVAEKIEAALEAERKKQVVVGVSGTGVLQQVIRSERSKDTSFAEGSLDLLFVARPMAYTTFFADLEAIGGNGPDQSIHSSTGLNADAGSLQDTDGVDRVSVREVWLGGDYFGEHLKAVAGKIDLTNYFDINTVANDETSQFLSNAFVNNPTLQQPRNGPGVVAFYDTKKSLRIGVGIQSPSDSGTGIGNRPYGIAEVDYNTHAFFGHEGNYRLWGHLNGSRSGDNKGFGISVDQVLIPTLTAFARYGLNNPKGAVNKYAWSMGVEKKGVWNSRPLDVLGVAFGQQMGTSTKIDTLSELYYRLFLTDHLAISPHLQWLIRSSRSDGLEKEENVLVAGLRSQVDF